MDSQYNFLYWYCDIIDTIYDNEDNSIVFNDLLVDVVILPDGFVKVLDLGELTDAVEMGIVDSATVMIALKRLDALLNLIYDGNLKALTKNIEDVTKGGYC